MNDKGRSFAALRMTTIALPYNRAVASEPKSEPRRVRCVINGKEIDVWEGYRLWDAALDADARLWHWCGGQGQCTTCAVIPVSGAENLTPPTGLEKFSVQIWLAKPLAFIRKRWKGQPKQDAQCEQCRSARDEAQE